MPRTLRPLGQRSVNRLAAGFLCSVLTLHRGLPAIPVPPSGAHTLAPLIAFPPSATPEDAAPLSQVLPATSCSRCGENWMRPSRTRGLRGREPGCVQRTAPGTLRSLLHGWTEAPPWTPEPRAQHHRHCLAFSSQRPVLQPHPHAAPKPWSCHRTSPTAGRQCTSCFRRAGHRGELGRPCTPHLWQQGRHLLDPRCGVGRGPTLQGTGDIRSLRGGLGVYLLDWNTHV